MSQKTNEDLNKRKDTHVRTGRLTIQMAIMPKLIYRFNAISNKFPAGFFGEIGKVILKFTRNYKESRIVKTILKKMNKVGGLRLLNFKTYKVIVIKTVCY